MVISMKTIFVMCLVSIATASKGDKDSCEYDMDLTSNVIKIVCQGSASRVNVYADTAHVSGDEPDRENTKNVEDESSEMRQKDRSSFGPEVKSGGTGRPTSGRGTKKGRRRKFPQNPSSKAENPENPYTGIRRKSGTTSSTAPQKDHWLAWELPKPVSGFSTVVWNATQKLDDAKKKLSSYTTFIRNISSQLSDGDVSLRADMDTLRRTSNSATVLKEGIIAAMRNQYNFMRSALLTRNNEVERLVKTLQVLVDVTTNGLQGALIAHNTAMEQVSHINATMSAVRKLISHELRRRRRRPRGHKSGPNQRACPKEISAFGAGRSRKVKDVPVGSYMVESMNPNDPGMVWIMEGSAPNDQVLEFDIDNDIDYNLVARYISLPFFCVGTGHVVFRRHFYCHINGTNRIVKYHIKRMDIVAEVDLPGAGHSNKYPYQSGQNTDVDLAIDEIGLWVMYATDASHGNVVISKINHQDMEIDRTWVTNYPKRRLGNAFMICGVMYATDSSSDAPTYIRYSYDTSTQKDRVWEPGKLPFANSATPTTTSTVETSSKSSKGRTRKEMSNCVMLSYDFRSSTIFSWNNANVEKFAVYFKDTEP